MDTRIPLMGQPVDFAGSYSRGLQLAQQQNQVGRENALASLYQQQGPQIASGDPAALNALAGIDPAAALGVQQTRQGMDIDQERLQMARDAGQREAQRMAAQATAEQVAAEAEKGRNLILQGTAMYEAWTAGDQGAGLALNSFLQQNGIQGDARSFPQIMAVTAGALDTFSTLQGMRPQAPDPLKGAPDNMMWNQPGNPGAGVSPIPGTQQSQPDPLKGAPAGYMWNSPGNPGAGVSPIPGVAQATGGDRAEKIRNEFNGIPAVKSFATQADAYGRIKSAMIDQTGASDLALVYAYMKMLDPGSVVREGEFATAETAGGIPAQVYGLYNKVLTGQRLTPEVRADFSRQADNVYAAAERQYSSLESQYNQIAKAAGLGEGSLIDYRYKSGDAPPPGQNTLPPPPDGIDPSIWQDVWDKLSPEDQKALQ